MLLGGGELSHGRAKLLEPWFRQVTPVLKVPWPTTQSDYPET